MQDRLDRLDGLRALAVLLVVLFHFFSRWHEGPGGGTVYPYESVDALWFGAYGVQLFFMISGFVVSLTLEKCHGLPHFAIRRFARLWPMLWVSTVLVGVVLLALPVGVFALQPGQLLPSLTLAPPAFWSMLNITAGPYVDGVLWSLWVEVLFYGLAGVIYFWRPGRFLRNLTIAALLLTLVQALIHWRLGGEAAGFVEVGYNLASRLALAFPLGPNIWWFVFGAALYTHWREGGRAGLGAAALAVPMQLLTSMWLAPWGGGRGLGLLALVLTLFLIFAATVLKPHVAKPLAHPWPSLVGRSSYSLYLLHQAIGVTVVAAAARAFGWNGPIAVTFSVLTITLITALSIGTHKWIEKPSQRWILGLTNRPPDSPQHRDRSDSTSSSALAP